MRRIEKAPSRSNIPLFNGNDRHEDGDRAEEYGPASWAVQEAVEQCRRHRRAAKAVRDRFWASLLPYRVFAKDQRITQTAIVENKRLSHALSLVKAQQELKRETTVLTNNEKSGYKKRSRSVYGPDSIENALAPKAVEMTDSLCTSSDALALQQQEVWMPLLRLLRIYRSRPCQAFPRVDNDTPGQRRGEDTSVDTASPEAVPFSPFASHMGTRKLHSITMEPN